MNTDFNDLASRAERGELTVKPGTVRRGTAASTEAQRLLLEATGATNIQDMTQIALGRPRVGAPGGESPVVRARVPQALKARLAALAEREHRKESDLVRDALAAYLETHAAS